MTGSVLASKKNVIIAGIVVVTLVLMVGSYYSKKARIEKQTTFGGQIEVVFDRIPSPQEYFLIQRGSKKFSLVNDMVSVLPLPNGLQEVNIRAIDRNYPLMGEVILDRKQNKIALTQDLKNRNFGIAVNQAFLDKSGLKFGDAFKVDTNFYEIRAFIVSLPDRVGKDMMQNPMIIMPHQALGGTEIFKRASKKALRYRIINPEISAERWEKLYREKLPKSNAVINRWDA